MKLNDKKRLKLITLTKGISMKFEDRLVYSVLLAYSRGLTVTRLASVSQIDRTKTLPKVLLRLTDQGLVKKEGNRYSGLPSEIVRIDTHRNGAETWYEKICYLKLYLPSKECPLTKKQIAVFCLKLCGKSATSLIAKLLNISRPTVISAVRALKQHGLLDVLGDPVELSDQQLTWWQDKARSRKDADGDLEKLSQHFSGYIKQFRTKLPSDNWVTLYWWESEFDKFGRMCKNAGYRFKQVEAVLMDVIDRLGKLVPVAKVFAQLPKLVEKAEEKTKVNQKGGAFMGTSSFGLFKCKVDDMVKALAKRKSQTP